MPLLKREREIKMKKLAIAGASLALAAMPVVGVFATDPAAVEDTITITVSETCTFTRTTGNGNYTATMSTNALNSSVGSSTFTAVCNNASGFSVSATPTALAGPTGSDAINYSATTPTAGSGSWTATKTEVAGNIAATNGVLMTAAGTTTGQTETVTYQVSTRANQAKGDYEGTMTYQLTQN